ncbi:Uncharacterised protein [uncultured archaeon]|nr:Uncharacterised protein [uncultured archaeon]
MPANFKGCKEKNVKELKWETSSCMFDAWSVQFKWIKRYPGIYTDHLHEPAGVPKGLNLLQLKLD